MLKYSKQRAMVLDYLLNTTAHPTAETVFAALKKKEPALSLATVYRNLNLLADMGVILRIGEGASDRFDADISPHDHFVCEKCGSMLDMPGKSLIVKEDYRKINTDFQIKNHSVYFYGVCGKCLKKNKKNL